MGVNAEFLRGIILERRSSSRKKGKEEEFLIENDSHPPQPSRLTSQENEKLDTDADREEGKSKDSLQTHQVINGTYMDMKLWSNFVPPPRP
ncbi:hypothetical protein NECAME_06958 [Necator americanus]|uniref:Uncharacterized protein n=1 Tax=Necator americanus TaxID=51031 RepID=W2TQE6_NECAM|nr:hypothetical protein NECAME_06958 [Necator americanus]ETN84270.1 hypothetical protein NECAME_06958 [Necator americanus]